MAVGILVAMVGPFGTFDRLTLGPRFLYWLAIVALAWTQWSAITWALRRLTASNPWPTVAISSVAVFIFAVPMSAEALLINLWLGVGHSRSFAAAYLWVAATGLSLCWILYFVGRLGAATWAPTGSTKTREVRFMRRIPNAIAGELLCLKMEDHYLRIHTTTGSDLTLLRMQDAVSELEGADGMQVHRSYWVARAAVDRVEKTGRKTALVLKNGLSVPVSDNFLPAVREAGWLD